MPSNLCPSPHTYTVDKCRVSLSHRRGIPPQPQTFVPRKRLCAIQFHKAPAQLGVTLVQGDKPAMGGFGTTNALFCYGRDAAQTSVGVPSIQ